MDDKNNTGQGNSGYGNSGYGNSGDRNSGYRNSGYGNSGNRNSGIFCSTEPKIRMFNKQTDLLWDEIAHPSFREFCSSKWINESEMTYQEKIDNPNFFTTKGYLRKIPWLEAWATYWEKSDQEERNKVLNLPNFDAEIFKEITGIDVQQARDILIVAGKKYKLVRDEGEL